MRNGTTKEAPEASVREMSVADDRPILRTRSAHVSDLLQVDALMDVANRARSAQQAVNALGAGPKKQRRPRMNLSQTQELEIIRAYADTDLSLTDLSKQFGIGPTYVYRLLEKYDISWRRGSPEPFEEWRLQNGVEELPETDEPELIEGLTPLGMHGHANTPEEEIVELADANLKLRKRIAELEAWQEPNAKQAAVTATLDDIGGSTWLVEITDQVPVYAKSIDAAIQIAREQYPKARITGVHEAR